MVLIKKSVSNVPTLKELILCLSPEGRKKVLELVQNTQADMGDCNGIIEIESQYFAIEEEIKKYICG